jgi:hypothetical protein
MSRIGHGDTSVSSVARRRERWKGEVALLGRAMSTPLAPMPQLGYRANVGADAYSDPSIKAR